MTASPLVGGFGVSRSSNAEDSQEINLFVEVVEGKDGKSPAYLQMTPGLDFLLTVGAGPIRGLHVLAGVLYVVSGAFVYQVTVSLISTNIGQIASTTGPVAMIDNGTQLAIFDGIGGFITTASSILNGAVPLTGGSVGSGGTGYVVGDDITLLQVGGIQDASAIVTVTAATAAGVVTAFSVSQGGFFSAPPTSFSQATTTGNGSGFTIGTPTFGTSAKLTQIDLPFTGNPVTATYQDGYGLVNESGTPDVWQSDAFDLSTWQALNFTDASSQPDAVVALATLNREVRFLKSNHTEIWVNAGQPGFVFQRLEGVFVEHGCGAPFSVALAGQSLVWLAQNVQGERYVVQSAGGYEPKRISTHAVETQLAKYSTVADAIGFVYQQEGHVFYMLAFPSGDATWCVDLTDSQLAGIPLWHQRAAFDEATGLFHRHWSNCYSTWRSYAPSYRPQGVLIQNAQEIATAGALANTAATFSTFVLSGWFYLPDGSAVQGMWFSNQTDDTAPGTGGVQIGIFNDTSSSIPGEQIVINLYDASNAIIVAATYPLANWSQWVWFGISVDTTDRVLQVFVNDGTGTGDYALTPTSIVWSSSNPVANTTGQAWHMLPASGP